MKSYNINKSINLRGYDSTVGMHSSSSSRIRKTSYYLMNAYKMIVRKCNKKHCV